MKPYRFFYTSCFLIAINVSSVAQLNTAGPTYLATIAASTSSVSPYSVTKDIARKADKENLTFKTGYALLRENNKSYAVFENKKSPKRAFQIIAETDDFSILCEHYAEEACDCFEGLHIYDLDMEFPVRVRRLLPFSLKINLIDEINMRSESQIATEDFGSVCEILEFFD
jgi:hypothetical protein